MRRVFKRIALNGLLTALILGLVGTCYAELAGLWLTGAGTRSAPDPSMQDALRTRVPLTMAAWGFLFIAVTEFGLYLWRGEPKDRVKKDAAAQPDEAELLLEELLQQAEAKTAREQAATGGAGGESGKSEGAGQPGVRILTPNPDPSPDPGAVRVHS